MMCSWTPIIHGHHDGAVNYLVHINHHVSHEQNIVKFEIQVTSSVISPYWYFIEIHKHQASVRCYIFY